jgi:hypothetical protein
MNTTVGQLFSDPNQGRIAADILINLHFITENNPEYSNGIVPWNVLLCRITSEVVTMQEFFWYLSRLNNGRYIEFCSARYGEEPTNTIGIRFSTNGYKFERGEI